MSEVVVSQEHNVTIEEAASRLRGFEEMVGRYGVKFQWQGGHADLKGVGVSGSIQVSEQDVVVRLKLGMLARAAGVNPERLRESIRKRLEQAFSA